MHIYKIPLDARIEVTLYIVFLTLSDSTRIHDSIPNIRFRHIIHVELNQPRVLFFCIVVKFNVISLYIISRCFIIIIESIVKERINWKRVVVAIEISFSPSPPLSIYLSLFFLFYSLKKIFSYYPIIYSHTCHQYTHTHSPAHSK